MTGVGCVERRGECIEQEALRHPELSKHDVEAMKNELVARRTGRATECYVNGDGMTCEAKKIVESMLRTVRARIRLQRYDEFIQMHPQQGLGVEPSVAGGDVADLDALDDLLVDDLAEPPDERERERRPECVSSTTTKNGEPEAIPRTGARGGKSPFPVLPLSISEVTHDALVARSIELAICFRRDKDYNAIRDEFVKVSLALNQFGLLAPAFRDQPKMPYKRGLWKAYTPLLIDQIVIDCHWLHCRHEQVIPRWPELRSMFAPSGKFDCETLASLVAAKNWSADFRADELMRLSDRQQAQLMQVRSKAMKERFRDLLEGKGSWDSDGARKRTKPKASTVRSAITNWADRNHRVRGQEDVYESIWLAMEVLGPRAQNKEIAEMVALRCGVPPLHPRTMAGKITTLSEVLG